MLTEKQLEMRKTGLGGSDVAAALGLSPWRTQIQLWAEKSGKGEPQPETTAMEWGTRLEPAIIDKFRDNNPHLKVGEASGTMRDERYPFLLASPDGYIVDEGGEEGILEAKTSSQQPWATPPPYYLLQIQQYLFVLGKKYAYFAVLFNGRDYREYGPIMADPAYEEQVIPELAKFWEAVENNTPLFEPKSMEDLQHLYAVEDSEAEADSTMLLQLSVYSALKDEADKAKKAADEVRLKLAEEMGSTRKIVDSEGKTLMVQVEVSDSTVVDGKLVKSRHPDVFEECSKTKKGYRSLRIYNT